MLNKRPIAKAIFDVRWRLEYNDKTMPQYGMWSLPANDLKQMAAFQKQNNISKAMIETKDRRTGETKIAVHCPGEDYCLFKWVGGVSAGFGNMNLKASPEILGLKLVTREVEATVWVNGDYPTIEPRKEHDKNFHYEGFGK